MNQINSVCVYSASSTKIDEVYFNAARQLGQLLAKRRIRLINGAGSIGLMRSVADAVLENGGGVTVPSTGMVTHSLACSVLVTMVGCWLARQEWTVDIAAHV